MLQSQRCAPLHAPATWRRSPISSWKRAARANASVTSRQNSFSEDIIVKVAHFILENPVLNQLGVAAAQRVMRQTAEKKGIPWQEHMDYMKTSQPMLDSIKAQLEDINLAYPDYYKVPFHAYADGNLCWKAAFEVDPTRVVVAARTFTDMTAQQAARTLDDNIIHAIQDHRRRHGLSSAVSSVLDVGCGTGASTVALAAAFPDAAVTGLDLSPYFLSVAQLQLQDRLASGQVPGRITYVHGLAEDTRLPSASFDLVNIEFVFHECPAAASCAILKEAARLLRPGGQVVIVDSDPNSEALRRLHPAIMLLREQTEPWMDEFRHLDLQEGLRGAGCTHLERLAVSTRHMAVIGSKE